MDINRDELRRQLADSRRDHDELMPAFRSILARVFDPSSRAANADKAAVLGVPSRRALLGAGGALAGATLLAACTDAKKKEQIAQSGTVPDPKTTTSLDPQVAADEAQRLDLNLLRTSQSVEASAITAYSLVLGTGKLSSEVGDALRLFQQQHRDHQAAMVSQISEVGGDPYSNPGAQNAPNGVSSSDWAQVNPTVWKDAVAPVIDEGDALDQAKIVKLAIKLEDVAASTYTKAGGLLSSPELRAFIMSVGGIEARHVSVLLGISTPNDPRLQVPFAVQKTASAVPQEAWVGPGDVHKKARITTTTAKPTPTTTKSTPATSAPGTTAKSGTTTTSKATA